MVVPVDTAGHREIAGANWYERPTEEIGAVLGEFVLAVLVTQMDVFHRLLGTTDITLGQFGWALLPALALLVLWEAGKLVARRSIGARA